MNCGNCGKEIKPGQKFCEFCGTPAPDEDFGRPYEPNIERPAQMQPVSNGQPMNGATQPVSNGQPMPNQQANMNNGQPMNGATQPMNNGQPMNGADQPMNNGQPMNGATQPVSNGQPMNNGASQQLNNGMSQQLNNSQALNGAAQSMPSGAGQGIPNGQMQNMPNMQNRPPYMPNNMAQPKKKGKVWPAVLAIVIIALLIVGIGVGALVMLTKKVGELASNDDQQITPATHVTTEAEDDKSDDGNQEESKEAAAEEDTQDQTATVSEGKTPEIYTGPLNYYTDEWIVDLGGGLFLNHEGRINSDIVGHSYGITFTSDCTESMILDSSTHQFFYLNSDLAMIEYAPGATCSDIAHDGGHLFYVIPTNSDNTEGDLYLFNTKTGATELVDKKVVVNSPCISPDGKTVAYAKNNSKGYAVYVAGYNLKTTRVTDEIALPYTVSNDAKIVYYWDSESEGFYRYETKTKTKTLICTGDIEHYYTNKYCTEVVAVTANGTYYIDDQLPNPLTVFEGGFNSIFSEYQTNVYSQFTGVLYDVETMSDCLIVSSSGDSYVLNQLKDDFIELPRSLVQVTNISYCDTEGMTFIYAADGKLYRAESDGNSSFTETMLVGDVYVTESIASYDGKDVWYSTKDGDLYHLSEGGTGELIDTGIDEFSSDDSHNFAWSVDSGYAYYTKGGVLYQCYNSSATIEEIMSNVFDLTYSQCKIVFLNQDLTELYVIFSDGVKQVF